MLDIVVKLYCETGGKIPYLKWIDAIKDKEIRIRIQQRIRRLELGNFGNCKALKDGVYELKLDFESGHRIYYGLEGKKIIILLCAGDKSTQRDDIEKAKKFWKDYKEMKNVAANKI